MAKYVFDASVCVAWCFEDETTEWVAKLFRDLSNIDQVIVPAHWSVEVCNTFLQAQRRNRVTPEQVDGFWNQFTKVPFAIEPPLNPSRARAVFQLSAKHSLTAYDGAYLEVALRNRISLATLDTQLATAAKKENIALL